MGSVKRLRDKVYRIVYDVPGTDGKRKQKRKTLYNVTKSEAEATLAKRKEKAKHSGAVRIPNLTVAELFGEFFRNQTEDALHIGARTLRGNVPQLHRTRDR